MRPRRLPRRAAGALLLSTVLLLGSPIAATSKAERPCWQALIADWADGRIDGVYSLACYRRAMRNAPEDLKTYSSLEEELLLAVQSIARAPRGPEARDSRSPAKHRAPRGMLERVAATSAEPLRSSGSGSAPHALLALGGASLLLAAAIGTSLTRRGRTSSAVPRGPTPDTARRLTGSRSRGRSGAGASRPRG